MKTARYFIHFENIEYSMCQKFEISKKEYENQVKFMKNQVNITSIDEETPVTEIEPKIFEYEKYTETIITFQCACAFTDLIKKECKEGYCFRNK